MASRNSGNITQPITSIKPKNVCLTLNVGNVPMVNVAILGIIMTKKKTKIGLNGQKHEGCLGKCLHRREGHHLSSDNILNRSLIIYRCINAVSNGKSIFLQCLIIISITLLMHHYCAHLLFDQLPLTLMQSR